MVASRLEKVKDFMEVVLGRKRLKKHQHHLMEAVEIAEKKVRV